MLKISELIEGNVSSSLIDYLQFMAAMELLEMDTCVSFLSTQSIDRRDFKFCIGIGNVKFIRMDPVMDD